MGELNAMGMEKAAARTSVSMGAMGATGARRMAERYRCAGSTASY